MKAGIKRMGDGHYEVIIEAQNKEEDAIVRQVFDTGAIIARGETPQEHTVLVLTTGIPPR